MGEAYPSPINYCKKKSLSSANESVLSVNESLDTVPDSQQYPNPRPPYLSFRVPDWAKSPPLVHNILTTRPQLVHYLPLVNKLYTAGQ